MPHRSTRTAFAVLLWMLLERDLRSDEGYGLRSKRDDNLRPRFPQLPFEVADAFARGLYCRRSVGKSELREIRAVTDSESFVLIEHVALSTFVSVFPRFLRLSRDVVELVQVRHPALLGLQPERLKVVPVERLPGASVRGTGARKRSSIR
jgi:hypothetical protein